MRATDSPARSDARIRELRLSGIAPPGSHRGLYAIARIRELKTWASLEFKTLRPSLAFAN